MTVQVVWLKRDLRVSDHEALYRASCAGPILCCYLLEDEYWSLPDTSNRQWQFIRESLLELSIQLERLGHTLLVLRGDACNIFNNLASQLGSFDLHSHQETGNLWTYQRDKLVAKWCRQHKVNWYQYAQHAVLRGSHWAAHGSKNSHRTNDRKEWRDHWTQFSTSALWQKPITGQWDSRKVIDALACQVVVPLAELPEYMKQDEYVCTYRQRGGRSLAVNLFKSFLNERGVRYQATISSPLTAELGCSRLSAHLAYGTISIKELLHQLDVTTSKRSDKQWRRSLSAFQSRLVWHCHFMQKLEIDPEAEIRNMNSLYDALDRPWDAERFRAWQHGHTGWPLVDACMRYLIAHGWVNFRMRAMLVSVACYTLKLPWQPVAQWLAQLFVDYEPGIHYPQIQMQSGTNGNQVLRIYNPLSQAQELDPEGIFVRRWVNELQNVPLTWLFAPEKMPIQLKQQYGAEHYPAPMVDFVSAHRAAKQEITVLRSKKKAAKSEPEPCEQFSLFADAR